MSIGFKVQAQMVNTKPSTRSILGQGYFNDDYELWCQGVHRKVRIP